jgi:hypothetical protein
MNRFRTGRPAPPWAGGQTGPMTVDVEALMASRDRELAKDIPKYVSPLTAYYEYARNAANLQDQAAAAERAAGPPQAADVEPHLPTGNVTVKLLYVGPGSKPEDVDSPPPPPASPGQHTDAEKLMAARAALLDEAKLAVEAAEAVINERARRKSPPEATQIPPQRSHHKRVRPRRKPRPVPGSEQITLTPSTPRPQSRPKSQNEIDLARHQRRCSICHHPKCDEIEEAFLQWYNIRVIKREFEIDESAMYRHAHALNLFKERNLSLRSALEFVIQEAQHIRPSAEGLVKAIRAYTRINDQGEWIDTPTTHIVKVMPVIDPELRNLTPNPASTVTLDVKKISHLQRENRVQVTVESPSGRPLLTESAPQLETGATPSKQRKEKFLTGARTHIRIFGKLANSMSKLWPRRGASRR